MKNKEKFYVISTNEDEKEFYIETITDDDTAITLRANELSKEKGIRIGIQNISTQKMTYDEVIQYYEKKKYKKALYSIIVSAEGLPSKINKNQ